MCAPLMRATTGFARGDLKNLHVCEGKPEVIATLAHEKPSLPYRLSSYAQYSQGKLSLRTIRISISKPIVT